MAVYSKVDKYSYPETFTNFGYFINVPTSEPNIKCDFIKTNCEESLFIGLDNNSKKA